MGRSIIEEVLGADFERLHPRVQERFRINSESGKGAIARGVMERVWRGPMYTVPFLKVGTWRNIMFPEQGENVPFTLENWAYVDSFGRETIAWLRRFELGDGRRFDAYMVRDANRNIIVEYQGTHQHLAVDVYLSVTENGGLKLLSGAQRFYEGRLSFRYPSLFTGAATVSTWFDEALGMHRIEAVVRNKVWGRIFGFAGVFDVEWVDVEVGQVPDGVRPLREEARL
jgi:hypothetical protein